MNNPVDLVHLLGLLAAIAGTVFVLVLPSSKTRQAVRFKATAAVCVGLGWAVVLLAIIARV